ncbi:hypothetical protein NEIELOOT_00107 [Neisseria elongata subsp. glycolytica ATCC 29315]|uniref:Uncharacterized protein n=1 Tax=Neisseria elongata subsp. glycolytica ATCC 29315 TaxID=546263 RepID=D4DM46_NEIEG|nr:hypothetical protein NEIELOOT_00107 [Neisseria elongata subsp. glycolytica ATCC 29315]
MDFGSDEGRLKITNQGFNFLETVFSDGLLNICMKRRSNLRSYRLRYDDKF